MTITNTYSQQQPDYAILVIGKNKTILYSIKDYVEFFNRFKNVESWYSSFKRTFGNDYVIYQGTPDDENNTYTFPETTVLYTVIDN